MSKKINISVEIYDVINKFPIWIEKFLQTKIEFKFQLHFDCYKMGLRVFVQDGKPQCMDWFGFKLFGTEQEQNRVDSNRLKPFKNIGEVNRAKQNRTIGSYQSQPL